MNRSASTLWFLGRAKKSTAVRAAIACLLMKNRVQMGPGRSASRGRKSGAGKSWKRGGICVASRCQVAHDFTQRHVLAACGEAAIPAPRYLELATQNWFCSGRGRPRAHFFKMLTCRLSLGDDWFDCCSVSRDQYIYVCFRFSAVRSLPARNDDGRGGGSCFRRCLYRA